MFIRKLYRGHKSTTPDFRFLPENLSLLVFSCCFLIFVKMQELIRWVRAAVAKKGLIRETIIIIDKGGYKLYFFEK